jgi:hypothetical protein
VGSVLVTRGDWSLQTWELEAHTIMIDISRLVESQTQIPFMYRRMRRCTRKVRLLCRQTVDTGRMTDDTPVSTERRLRGTLREQNCAGAEKTGTSERAEITIQ